MADPPHRRSGRLSSKKKKSGEQPETTAKRRASDAFQDEDNTLDDEYQQSEAEEKAGSDHNGNPSKRKKTVMKQRPFKRGPDRKMQTFLSPGSSSQAVKGESETLPEGLRRSKSSEEVYSDERTLLLQRFKTLLSNVKLKVHRKPTPAATAINHSIHNFFNMPVREGRTFVPVVERAKGRPVRVGAGKPKKTLKPWVFAAERTASDGTIERRYFGLWIASALTQTTADLVCTDLTKALNGWPGTIDAITSDSEPVLGASHIWGLIRASLARHDRTYLRSPNYAHKRDKSSFYLNPILVDPITFMPSMQWEYTISPLSIAITTDDTSTFIPKGFGFVKYEGGGTKGRVFDYDCYSYKLSADGQEELHDSGLPAELFNEGEDRDHVEKIEKLARGLLAATFMMVATPDQFRLFAENWIKERANKKILKAVLVYGGNSLVTLDRQFLSWSIVPSDQLRKDLIPGCYLPAVVVNSRDRARVVPVLEALNNTYISTASVTDAWIQAVIQADMVNEAIRHGEPSLSTCYCDEFTDSEIIHCCGDCGRSFRCGHLTMAAHGLRICKVCTIERATKPFDPAYWIRHRFRIIIARAEASGSEDKENEGLAIQYLRASIEGFEWKDSYCDQMRTLLPERNRHFAPSVDAAFPFGRGTDMTLIHSADNVVLTTFALNMMKHTHIPGFLEELARYLKNTDKIAESSELGQPGKDKALKEERMKMIALCTEFTLVRLLFPISKKGRSGLSNSRVESMRLSCQSGKLKHGLNTSAGARLASKTELPKVLQFGTTRLNWASDVLARMKVLIDEIQAEFGCQLDKSTQDRWVWVGEPGSMPAGWNSDVAFRFATDRLKMMTSACNRYFETIEDPETIFIEIVFIACVIHCKIKEEDEWKGKTYSFSDFQKLKSRYAEFLGLPMVLRPRSPLRMSIGHIEHGRQMLSGWTQGPTSLKDRNDAAQNMVAQTWASNMLLFDFDSECYEALKQMVREIKVPTEYYDPTISRTRLTNATIDDMYLDDSEDTTDTLENPETCDDFAMFGNIGEEDDEDVDDEGVGAVTGATPSNAMQQKYEMYAGLYEQHAEEIGKKGAHCLEQMGEAMQSNDRRQFEKFEEMFKKELPDDESL
ncbi:hypothetical protein P153DRAFT_380608 [Dothidotthia symphoricarpi CBS 119687]|uniref:Uncharacterized protein n=1 Tax=Dothidotthia symphoricarpi CBS 119687 TaxID=1392245 RepID=A0A6A6AT95_9PLEO|nr:uncharacterized protein P153DRAFT_380608 [Dothidotthia symphoricarpi CBS 119687]KAF2134796.1 hypothetical protein P153DRAFT_380608 [Dothidotthia symphoricarpi CBS 119687]